MQAHSTVRQNLTAFFVVFGLIGALGVFLLYTSLVVSPASSSAILVAPALVLAVIAVATLLLGGLSVTLRADIDPSGVTSHEFGARWSFERPQVHQVWIVAHRVLPYLAVLPAPGSAPLRHRTSWRSRRFGLPDQVRTIRIEGAATNAIAAAVLANWGRAPEPLQR